MHLNALSQTSFSNSFNTNPNFKARFVFTKDSAMAFKHEMKDLAYRYPIKTLKGKNPLQILVKRVKTMYPEQKVKLFFEPSRHIGQSPINYRAVFTPPRWVADSGNNKIVKAGFHMADGDFSFPENPIQNLLKSIVNNPDKFFK